MSNLYIGDTPEHLGSFLAADAIMIDGKIVTREDVRKMQSEIDALAATVEALRKIFPLKVLIGCDAHLNYPVSQYNDMVEAFNASPRQHLRHIRAEAGRAGLLLGWIFSAITLFYSAKYRTGRIITLTASGNARWSDG